MLIDYRASGAPFIVSRGWADPQNRESIERTTPVVPGRAYTIARCVQPRACSPSRLSGALPGCANDGDNAASGYWTDTRRAIVHVMLTLSPTFTFASAALSCTRLLYFHPFGPLKVIEGTVGSMAEIVAVIER